MNTALTAQQTKTIIPMTRSGAARWPTSDRNPGRLRIGTGGRLHIGMRGRLRRNPQLILHVWLLRHRPDLLGGFSKRRPAHQRTGASCRDRNGTGAGLRAEVGAGCTGAAFGCAEGAELILSEISCSAAFSSAMSLAMCC